MATLKYDYLGVCAGGGHGHLNIMVNGAVYAPLTIDVQQMINPPPVAERDVVLLSEILLMFHRRKWLKANPSGTNAQYIAALEAEEWVF